MEVLFSVLIDSQSHTEIIVFTLVFYTTYTFVVIGLSLAGLHHSIEYIYIHTHIYKYIYIYIYIYIYKVDQLYKLHTTLVLPIQINHFLQFDDQIPLMDQAIASKLTRAKYNVVCVTNFVLC